MKKLSVLALLLLFLKPSFAQDDDLNKYSFGLRFNPLVSFLKVDEKGLEGTGPKIGFSYGLMAEHNFAKNYALGIEIRLNHHRLEFETDQSMFVGPDTLSFKHLYKNIEMRMQYFEVPLYLRMKTNEIGYTTYFGQFGIGTGIRTKAKILASAPGVKEVELEKDDFKWEGTNILRLSMIIGFGAQYSLGGSTYLYGSATFNNGFTNVVKNDDIKSAYVSINLGVLF